MVKSTACQGHAFELRVAVAVATEGTRPGVRTTGVVTRRLSRVKIKYIKK